MEDESKDQLPVQDQTVLESLLRYGPPSFLVQLIQVYLETTPAHVDNAEASFAAGDWKALTFAAHSLKSSAGNLGLPRMLDTVKMLELAARSKDMDEAKPLVEGLRKTWSDSCAALEEYRARL